MWETIQSQPAGIGPQKRRFTSTISERMAAASTESRLRERSSPKTGASR